MATPPELSSLRAEIDRLDHELVTLLAKRRDVVRRVAAVKQQHALPAVDPAREAAMKARLAEKARKEGVPEELVLRVMDAILDESRALVAR